MRRYAAGDRDTGAQAYESGAGYIRVRFRDGSVYEYTDQRPGAEHVAAMQRLAEAGRGLTTYINQHVRARYARRVR